VNLRARLSAPHVRLWPVEELAEIEDERELDTRLALQRLVQLDRQVCQGEYGPFVRNGVVHVVSGLRRRGDHISASIGWWRRALKETCSRRIGKDYARECRDHALACMYLIDSGEHDSPRGPGRYRQSGSCRWWPTYLVPRLLEALPCGAYGPLVPEPAVPTEHGTAPPALLRTASLWRLAIRQAPLRRPRAPSRCSERSVQWAFAHTGPP
jgi:hypothetical protein